MGVAGTTRKPKTLAELKREHGMGGREVRESSTKRGYDRRWRKARALFLKDNPLCLHCQEEGVVELASVVDHIKPHKGDMKLFWDFNNWQPLCKKHHDIKTVKHDGGFGKTPGGV